MSISIKDFMECINYQVTEGSEYGWSCFGKNVYQLDSWNGKHKGDGGYSVSIVFDKDTQVVFQMEAWDYDEDRAYRWTNPTFLESFNKECDMRNIPFNEACDDINFVDLDLEEDILSKASAIAMGAKYDTRVTVVLNLEDKLVHELMRLAHEADTTLNLYVEKILLDYISRAPKECDCGRSCECSCGI